MVQCVMAVSQDEFETYLHFFGGEIWQSGEFFLDKFSAISTKFAVF